MSIAMVLSIAVVGISDIYSSAQRRWLSASRSVETHRIYFAMLISGRAQNTVQIIEGIFWWNGSDTDGFVEETASCVAGLQNAGC